MKHFLAIVVLFISFRSFGQYEGWTGPDDLKTGGMHVAISAGAGLATQYNYDVAYDGDLSVYFPVHHKYYFGALIQYQAYSTFYQRSSPVAAFSNGFSGYSLLDQNNYLFIAPQIIIPFGPRKFKNLFEFYANAGVGLLMSGKETVHKWDSSNNYPLNAYPNYDSTINSSKNVYSMIYRVGVGLVEQLPGRNYRAYFTFTEDLSFITGDLTSSTTSGSPNRNPYSPNKLAPVFFTVKMGVNLYHHTSWWKHPR